MSKLNKSILLLIFVIIPIMAFSQGDSLQSLTDTITLSTTTPYDATYGAPTEVEVTVPTAPAGVSFNSILRGVIGMISILFIAFLFSRKRRAINWGVVFIGLGIQIALAIGVLYVPFVKVFFEFIAKFFVKIMDFTGAGADFLFGSLLDTSSMGYIFAFNVLPTIIFFSALTSLLYYLNVIQIVVVGIAWLLKKAFRISGAEGLTVSGNIFL